MADPGNGDTLNFLGVGFLTLVLNLVLLLVGGGRWSQKIEGKIDESARVVREDLTRTMVAERSEIGETFRGMREKMHAMELEAAKAETKALEQFVRRESFHSAVNAIHAQLQAAEEAANSKFEKIEIKLERIFDRLPSPS